MATLAYAELDLAAARSGTPAPGHRHRCSCPPPGAPAAWEGRSTPLGAFGSGGAVRGRGRLAPATGCCSTPTDWWSAVTRPRRALALLVEAAGRTHGLRSPTPSARSREMLGDERAGTTLRAAARLEAG